MSVDEQAVTQMNIVLQADEINNPKPTSKEEVANILIANGYNGDFEALYRGYTIVWMSDVNRVALMENNEIVYPKEYKGRTYDSNTMFVVEMDLPHAFTDNVTNRVNSDGVYKSSWPVDAAMSFKTLDDAESIKDKHYKDYYVEFVLSSNMDITFQGYLWGRFLTEGVDANGDPDINILVERQIPAYGLDVTANTDIDVLLPTFGFPVSYSLAEINDPEAPYIFECGLFADESFKNDPANAGFTVSLELRMYADYYEGSDGELGTYSTDYYKIGPTYTFQIC